jgi:hypothetical protein
MRQRAQQLTFLSLVLALIGARTIIYGGSLDGAVQAVGSAVVEIPAAIILGRIVLWFVDKLLLFALNIANPESPRAAFARTIWQTLSLSLAIGFPLWLLSAS